MRPKLAPWYKVVTPRKEVREGRSFNPDEFAIHLEQVVAGTAPEDYRDPVQFFARTSFTRALREHGGMVLRRLAGETAHTAPVMTLVTQFGGGKTHTLAALYHMVTAGEKIAGLGGVQGLLAEAKLREMPRARVAVFVGNAWDPREGRETPWIDIARQLAGDAGVAELGKSAAETPPGTEALGRVFAAAGAPVLVLFDEVLNYVNRHRRSADAFHAFIQNLTVAMTGTTRGAAVISLPRSQVEMTEFDMQWQDKITKVVRRVAKDLIANDESEIGEVVRRRLFDDPGDAAKRAKVAAAYADWCFERRAQLPPEWTRVDNAAKEAKAREHLRSRFEACYPFHPATLSVFQRKWQALTHFQQTRGTLAMLAQWISWAHRDGFRKARTEPLITLGSAPLHAPEFRAVVLGQLGESRLLAAIDADIAGDQAHARALDADTAGPLRDIHRRVGAAILFESSGGQVDKIAHLPELRFALGEPEVDTTSVDTMALALESRAYFVRKVGTDGFKISHKPTLKKVVSDRRASLDEETEIKPAIRDLVQREFDKAATLPRVFFPEDGTAIPDTPRLTLVVADPDREWHESGPIRDEIAQWTRERNGSARLYPAALVWAVKKPGRKLREKVENWLAWRRVQKEEREGSLGGEFEASDRADLKTHVADFEAAARDEVWAGYRFAVLAEAAQPDGIQAIDLGAGHSSIGEGLCGRVVTALKTNGQLNESVGAGYVERNWPNAFMESGAWPLSGLRQSFLNGALTRLIDPDGVLKKKIVEFVEKGEFGLASGQKPDGTYQRIWFQESIGPEEVAFESGVFLLLKKTAEALTKEPDPGSGQQPGPVDEIGPSPGPGQGTGFEPGTGPDTGPDSLSDSGTGTETGSGAGTTPAPRTIQIHGDVPPEVWNRMGTKLIPKLRSGTDLKLGIRLRMTTDGPAAQTLRDDLQQILEDLGIADRVKIE